MKYFIFISQYLKMNNNNIPIEKIKFLKEGENNKVDIFSMSQISNDTDFIIKNQKIIEKRCSIKIVVEVDEKEIKNTKFINAKKYKHIEKSKYELIEEKELSLINYALIYDMSVKDLNKGKIVMVDKKNGYYIINTDDNLLYASDFKQQRQYLKMKDSLCDIYFYTEDSDILSKYKEDLTVFERIKDEKYRLKSGKFFLIDSINYNVAKNLDYVSFNILRDLSIDSVQVYYEKDDENGKYNVSSKRTNAFQKKAYLIVNSSLNNYLYNKNIQDLLPFINVFTYEDINYTKTNLKDYLQEKNILKYIKKP